MVSLVYARTGECRVPSPATWYGMPAAQTYKNTASGKFRERLIAFDNTADRI